MANATLPIQVPTVPNGWCPTSWQEALAFFGKSLVILENSGFGFIIISSTAPGATDRDKIWFNTNDSRTYWWNNAIPAWVTIHETPASSPMSIFYRSTEDSLLTYDGGEDATVGDAAGPFWERDDEMDGKFPLGAGTLTGSNTIVSLDATGGVDQVTLTGPQSGIAAHSHVIHGSPSDSGTTGDIYCKSPAATGNLNPGNTQQAGPTNAAEAHTNLPPYRVGIWIRRTARIYRRAG